MRLLLEAIYESSFAKTSHGFRPNHSCHTALSQVQVNFTGVKWFVEGDIKGFFDNIDHDVMIHILAERIKDERFLRLIRKFLKAGYLEDWVYHNTYSGTPQGGIISPILANIYLSELDAFVEKLKSEYDRQDSYRKPQKEYSQTLALAHYWEKKRKTAVEQGDEAEVQRAKGRVDELYAKLRSIPCFPAIDPTFKKIRHVRYADDFIITGRTREALEEIKPLVENFLESRGLTLSEEKTKITHIEEGFDFLGYNIRKYNGILLIKPSKKSLKGFMEKIRGIIDSNKGSKQESLIRLLNPVIVGWVNYYKNCVASDTFRKADYLIFEKLWQWAKRRHPKKGKYWIASRYFTRIKNRNWCFVANFKRGKADDKIALKRLYDTKITRYVKVKGEANPLDPEWKEYFEKRKTYKMLKSLNGRKSLLYMWEKQNHLCPICGEPIDKEHSWGTNERIVNGKKVNFLVHDSCRRKVIQLNKCNNELVSNE